MREVLAKSKENIVVFGLASNQDDYLKLFDKILLLHCKKEIFLRRLNTREGVDEFAREKSEQEHILSWYKDFEDKMIKLGAVPINTEEPLNVVLDKIISEF